LHLADGDGAIESHDRRGSERHQLVVQSHDLQPVRSLDACSVRVYGGDCGLELVWARLVAAKAAADDRLTVFDQAAVPAASVLLAEQREGAVGPHS
jgi:hypothetical protein